MFRQWGPKKMQTITVAGGNLFQLALQYLGDSTQWNRLALANLAALAPAGGVPDPMLTGLVSLNIPALNANAGGGIYVPASPD
jgi:nucleoid-associated protein YgaU